MRNFRLLIEKLNVMNTVRISPALEKALNEQVTLEAY